MTTCARGQSRRELDLRPGCGTPRTRFNLSQPLPPKGAGSPWDTNSRPPGARPPRALRVTRRGLPEEECGQGRSIPRGMAQATLSGPAGVPGRAWGEGSVPLPPSSSLTPHHGLGIATFMS